MIYTCNTAKLCPNIVISTDVAYASGVLTVTIPAGSYGNGNRYGLVIAQTIPSETIIGAPVVIQISGGTQNYPLLKCNGAQATAMNIRTRTKYNVQVVTSTDSGSFRMLGRCCPAPSNNLAAIGG